MSEYEKAMRLIAMARTAADPRAILVALDTVLRKAEIAGLSWAAQLRQEYTLLRSA